MIHQQLEALSDHLATRRQAILKDWRKAVDADPEQTTSHALTRRQFNDHIPQVLDAFESKLRSDTGSAAHRSADREQEEEEVKHGLHRWQQGYPLQELVQEWGHLQACLFAELEAFASAHSGFGPAALMEANRRMIALVNTSISESAGQYQRMQKAEAAGHVNVLRQALDSVQEIERRRSALIHEAVHDLRGDVFSVSVAASLLEKTNDTALAKREQFVGLLHQGVGSLTAMLSELMELARLDAGQETRELADFDAADLATKLCDVHRPLADERGLFLEVDGPAPFPVEGDPARVRRLLQNLLLNALKYTERGGVVVSWGEERENWWLMVKDTGSGLSTGPHAPLAVGLKEATASARESDEMAAASKGQTSQVLAPAEDAEVNTERFSRHQPSEGIGLSIVKRLCELLDASLELVSSPETGTTFRVVLPRSYQNARGTSSAA
ncbi:MAG: ATP-binding protein [Candidatus Binatia bacterium]